MKDLGIEITIHDTPQSTGFAERGISQIKKSIEDHMSQQAIRKATLRTVDAYGCVTYKKNSYYVGHEFFYQEIEVVDNNDKLTAIVNGKTIQLSIENGRVYGNI